MVAVSSWLQSINSSYPDPVEWPSYKTFAKRDAFRFARLWLLEGIPFAFSKMPAAYEVAREEFARSLGENPRNVGMTGSGRLGFSLSNSKFGRPYDNNLSDIDLFLVSEVWFAKIRADAEKFVGRFNAGLATPRNLAEERYWPENAANLPRTIARGFVDQKLIPSTQMYPAAQRCYSACAKFSDAVQFHLGPNVAKKVSVRVYSNWERAESQIGGTLLYNLAQMGLATSE